MNKLINIVLAAYIAFVACYPCNDIDICVDDDNKSAYQATISEHEHSPDETDLCSPFCICSCCSSTINQPKYFYFTIYFPQIREVNFPVKAHAVKTVSYSIWQPPRTA